MSFLPNHPLWKSGFFLPRCSDAGCGTAGRSEERFGGSAQGTVDVDDWITRLPKAPLPYHRCEYGGYRGTWSSWMGLYWRIYDAIQLRISPVQTKAAGLEIERRESGRGGAGTWCCVWHAHIRLMDYLLATEIVSHRDCGRQGVIFFFFCFFLAVDAWWN